MDPLPEPAKPAKPVEPDVVTIPTAITDNLEAFIPAQWSETPESREVRLVRQLVQLHTENADLDTLYVVLDLLRDKKQ